MRVPWLGDVLRNAGLTVIEYGQPRGRGKELATIRGVVGHDTVTTRSWQDEQVAALLEEGYKSLPGPLAQIGLDRQGRCWWIADARCNHNGYGRWGNNAIGFEVFCAGGKAGMEEPWNDAQVEAFTIGSRAILTHLRMPLHLVEGHKEQDPERKIDPFGIDMAQVRIAVAAGDKEDEMTPAQMTELKNFIQATVNKALELRDPLLTRAAASGGDGATADGLADELARRLAE